MTISIFSYISNVRTITNNLSDVMDNIALDYTDHVVNELFSINYEDLAIGETNRPDYDPLDTKLKANNNKHKISR